MNITAIIAEYNPFHNGHQYLVDKAHRLGADGVLSVMSGNWVQRGDIAIISKFARTKQALECGVDLVAELPTPWAMATAQKFAKGAVDITESLGANTLIFGSECGDIERIMETVYCIRSSEFSGKLRQLLDSGMTFAKARETAVNEICQNGELLRSPNDTLAIEYISAAKALNSKCKFVAVKRTGATHDSSEAIDGFCSASEIRRLIKANEPEKVKEYMPSAAYKILLDEYNSGHIADISRLEKTILTALRTNTVDNFKQLPDISEGIENRLQNAVKMSSSFDELMNYTATKRYTNARLRRLILSAFLKLKACDIPESVPYIRILGCNETGSNILQSVRSTSKIPIIMRSSSLKDNSLFINESTATDIYSLALASPLACNEEYTNGIIIKR